MLHMISRIAIWVNGYGVCCISQSGQSRSDQAGTDYLRCCSRREGDDLASGGHEHNDRRERLHKLRDLTADFSVIDPCRMMHTDGSVGTSTRPIVHAWRAQVNISATRCKNSSCISMVSRSRCSSEETLISNPTRSDSEPPPEPWPLVLGIAISFYKPPGHYAECLGQLADGSHVWLGFVEFNPV
jgi:hypothetical protein